MRNIQQELVGGYAKGGDVRIDPSPGPDARSDASCAEATNKPPRKRPRIPKRWVPRRKAEVVAAVRSGRLSFDEACKRYALSIEEFRSWERVIDRYGLTGLRVNKTQHNRRLRPSLTGD